MSTQIVISIGREYGSGGHEIGEKLADKLGLEFVDRSLIEKIAKETDTSIEEVLKYDEKPRRIFTRSVRGYSNSPEHNMAEFQFSLLKAKAIKDESFVVVGRCSNMLFKDICPNISIYVTANKEDRIKRIMDRTNKKAKEALSLINKEDKIREAYHNSHCDAKWKNANSYDICVNSSVLGIDGSVDFLFNFIKSYMNNLKK